MSTLRNALKEYIAVRRGLGAQLREPALTLGHFVEYLECEGAQYIATTLALRWARQSQGVQRATWARRLSMVRGFAVWQSGFDPRTEIPPRGLIDARHRRNTPHIYTQEQIEQLMSEAARLPSATGLRALTYTTLIGLLAATGLRPAEALALEVRDVDLTGGVLAIRQTKFGKYRFVPVTECTRAALFDYARRRDALCPDRETRAFLLSEQGRALEPHAARRTFALLSCRVGLRAPAEGKCIGRGPRLMDFRHTFATRRLVEWYRSGVNVQQQIPRLSTYLGHISPSTTYWYIQAVPELLQLATEQCSATKEGDCS